MFESTIRNLPAIFIFIGFFFSLFYGCFALEIHTEKPDAYANKPCSWKFHQWWFNFLGSLAGWTALAYLIKFHDPSLFNFGLVVVSLLGITGHLPLALYMIAQRGVWPGNAS